MNLVCDPSKVGFSPRKRKRLDDEIRHDASSKKAKVNAALTKLDSMFMSLTKQEQQELLLKHKGVVEVGSTGHLLLTSQVDVRKAKNEIERILFSLQTQDQHPVQVPASMSTGKGVMRALCYKWLRNDVDNIRWWENGSVKLYHPKDVSPMTADNFLLIYNVPDTEMNKGKFMVHGKLKSFLFRWLESNGLSGATVFRLRLSMDKDMTHGGDRPQPFVKYKIGTPDLPLEKVLAALTCEESMNSLQCRGFRFYNIDIKTDIACTVTDKVIQNVNKRLAEVCNDENYQLLPSHAGNNTITVKDHYQNIAAKIYNKFEETLCSPGTYNTIGCQIHKWLHTSSTHLRSAIQNPETQRCGLSRIEIRIGGIVPTLDTCQQLMNKFKRVFLPDTNFTPIREQWKMLQPKHSVVIYDVCTGNYCIGYWNHRNTYTVVGLYGKEKKVEHLFHRIKLCTLSDTPIDFYMVHSKVWEANGIEDLKEWTYSWDFEIMKKGKDEFPQRVIRTDWSFKHLRLHRIGYKKTHFFDTGLYTSRTTTFNLDDIGLVDTDYMEASMGHRRIKSTAKLKDIQLYREQEEVETDVTIVNDGVPTDGEYGFIKSFKAKFSLPLQTNNTPSLYIQLSNNDIYVVHDRWKKWKQLFVNNEPFVFYVTKGVLSLCRELQFPPSRALSMMKIPDHVTFLVIQTTKQFVNAHQKTVFMIDGFDLLSFVATADMEHYLEAGYVKFRTCGEVTNKSGHKERTVEPYVVT